MLINYLNQMNDKLSDINLIFSTPVWTFLIPKYKEVNKKMNLYIKSLHSKDKKGVMKSNIKGWHSPDFDLKEENPVFFINQISSSLNKCVKDMGWDLKRNKLRITSMWAIINPPNASNSRHIHSNNFISAAYYVKAPKNAGDIVFYDPRSANDIRTPIVKEINKLNSKVFKIDPQEGLLVLFPSYLHHSVEANESTKDRIVISFNINLNY